MEGSPTGGGGVSGGVHAGGGVQGDSVGSVDGGVSGDVDDRQLPERKEAVVEVEVKVEIGAQSEKRVVGRLKTGDRVTRTNKGTAL